MHCEKSVRMYMQRAVALLAALAIALCMVPVLPRVAHAAPSSENLKIYGIESYDQVQAVLKIVNQKRKSKGLNELVLDTKLTETAMQRAAELVVYYGHTRPDGTSCFTAWPSGYDEGGSEKAKENIDYGYTETEFLMKAWYDDEEILYNKYLAGDTSIAEEKFSHYLNIINPDFKSIGIGCFYQEDGISFWEQAFSSKDSGLTQETRGYPNRNGRTISVNYNLCGTKHYFISDSTISSAMHIMKTGQTCRLSYCVENDALPSVRAVVDPTSIVWKSSATNICSVDPNGTASARKQGMATIRASLPSGRELINTWMILGNISEAKVTVANQTYTGSGLTPAVTVKYEDKTLKEDTDYTVAYANNTNVGTAKVTITGRGNYAGTKTATFTISKKSSSTSSNADAAITIVSPLKNVGTVKFSKTAYTYNGSFLSPKVIAKDTKGKTISSKYYTVTRPKSCRNVGSYTYNVKFKGAYSGAVNLTFKINPKGTSIKSLTRAKKAFTVKWNKQATKMPSSRITGYQVRYSLKSNMMKATTKTVKGYKSTKLTVKKLKAKKRYYVQVRTYMKVKGKTYYSAWSKAKSVVTKM